MGLVLWCPTDRFEANKPNLPGLGYLISGKQLSLCPGRELPKALRCLPSSARFKESCEASDLI